MFYEVKPCRWCGRDATFHVQLVLGGGSELVTNQRCIAASRVLLSGTCEPTRITHAVKSRGMRRRR